MLRLCFCLQQIVVALQTQDGRKTISGSKLRLAGAKGVKEFDVSDQRQLESALREHFGLQVSDS